MKKYTDMEFPADDKSICPRNSLKPESGLYEWSRAHKIPALTDDDGILSVGHLNPDPMDIEQGEISNSYFVNSLSVLAENRKRIAKLFSKIDQDSLNFGAYEIHFAIDGELI